MVRYIGSSSRRLLNQSTHSRGGVLDGVSVPPRPALVDDLGLVEADDRLGQRVVVGVANAANRGLRANLGEALGVANRQVLGEFNSSSQHILFGGCDESEEATVRSVRACEDEVARSTSGSASIRTTVVLAGNRRWLLERGRGSKSWSITSGWEQMVSGVRRHATITTRPVGTAADGALFVAR